MVDAMRDKPRKPSDLGGLAGLGRAIMAERAARGLTRQELAEQAGLSYPYLSEIENGSKRASSRALVQIAEALGLNPSALMATAERLPPTARDPEPNAPLVAMSMSAAVAAERTSWFHTQDEQVSDARADLEREVLRLLPRLQTQDLETVVRLMQRLTK